MSMCITWFLQNYFKKIILEIFFRTFHIATLGAKASQCRPFQIAHRDHALLAIP